MVSVSIGNSCDFLYRDDDSHSDVDNGAGVSKKKIVGRKDNEERLLVICSLNFN